VLSVPLWRAAADTVRVPSTGWSSSPYTKSLTFWRFFLKIIIMIIDFCHTYKKRENYKKRDNYMSILRFKVKLVHFRLNKKHSLFTKNTPFSQKRLALLPAKQSKKNFPFTKENSLLPQKIIQWHKKECPFRKEVSKRRLKLDFFEKKNNNSMQKKTKNPRRFTAPSAKRSRLAPSRRCTVPSLAASPGVSCAARWSPSGSIWK
jgi:hypothetical protein